MDLFEIALWVLGLLLGFVLGFFANWYFYRKQSKENEANVKILKELRQHVNAQIRLGDDKRGRIVERPDGTIAIDWKVELAESVGLSATAKVVVNKKRGNANFVITHDENGKESMIITSKNEDGKEIKIEIPWETIQQLRK